MSDTCALNPDEDAEVGNLCVEHFSRLRSSLLELPAVAMWVQLNLAASGTGLSERVSGSRDDPSPLRLDALDLVGPDSRHYVEPDPDHFPAFLLFDAGQLVGVYSTWRQADTARVEEMRLAGVEPDVIRLLTSRNSLKQVHKEIREAGLDPAKIAAARERWQVRPTQRGGTDQAGADAFRAALDHFAKKAGEESGCGWRDIAQADLCGLVNWLAARLSWIAHQDWVDEFYEEIRRLGREAHGVAPWRPESRHLPDPCGSCGVRAVVAHIGEGWRRCEPKAGGCGKREQLSEYELRVLLPESRRAG